MAEKRRGSRKAIKIIFILLLILIIAAAWLGYQAFMGPSVTDKQEYLYVKTNDTFEDVIQTVTEQQIVKNPAFFRYIADAMEYPDNVKPGRYKLTEGMSNRRLIGNLRGGYQEAVKFRFENIRLKENFAALLGKNFEADSTAFIEILDNEEVAQSYGFTAENFFIMFIPN